MIKQLFKCLELDSIKSVGNDIAPDLPIEESKVREQWLRDYLGISDIIYYFRNHMI